jgi:hypothetical protein
VRALLPVLLTLPKDAAAGIMSSLSTWKEGCFNIIM